MPTTITSAGITFNDATSLTSATIPANAVGATQIANGSVTAAKLGTTEQTRIAKAWVNFNGGISNITTSSVSFSGTLIQCGTASAHGLSVGMFITILNQTGNNTVLNGTWQVTAVSSTTNFSFVISTTPAGTLGNFGAFVAAIRSSYNVSSVTKNGTGDYTVNFTTAMADANYSIVGISTQDSALSRAITLNEPNPSVRSVSSIRFYVTYYEATKYDSSSVSLNIFGN